MYVGTYTYRPRGQPKRDAGRRKIGRGVDGGLRICIQLIQIYHRLNIYASRVFFSRGLLGSADRLRASRRVAPRWEPAATAVLYDVGALVDPKRSGSRARGNGRREKGYRRNRARYNRGLCTAPYCGDYLRQGGLVYICFCHKA